MNEKKSKGLRRLIYTDYSHKDNVGFYKSADGWVVLSELKKSYKKAKKIFKTCASCINKTCLKKKHPCESVEESMKNLGVYSQDFIRPEMSSSKRTGYGRWREIPFSALNPSVKRDKNPYFRGKT